MINRIRSLNRVVTLDYVLERNFLQPHAENHAWGELGDVPEFLGKYLRIRERGELPTA